MYLTKIPTQIMFKLLPVIFFQNMCIVACDFSRNNKRALPCFPNGIGIAVL